MTKKDYFLLKIKPTEVDQKYNIDWESRHLRMSPDPTTSNNPTCATHVTVSHPPADTQPSAFVPLHDVLPAVTSTPTAPEVANFTTLVSHLLQEETPASQYASFLDWSKKERYMEFIPCGFTEQKDYYCFWDSEKIDTLPVVCPLSYSGGTFEVEGTFCSFDCCYAYINEHSKSNRVLYKDSSHLLHYLYYQLHPEDNWKSIRLDPAPSWRLLEKFQGKLSVQEFRKGFQKVLYLDTKLVSLPFVGRIYEKVNRF